MVFERRLEGFRALNGNQSAYVKNGVYSKRSSGSAAALPGNHPDVENILRAGGREDREGLRRASSVVSAAGDRGRARADIARRDIPATGSRARRAGPDPREGKLIYKIGV